MGRGWSKESQERWRSGATVVSLLAVPLVLALGTWLIQRSIAAESVKQQYVGLAISILREPLPNKDDKEAKELRRWAVSIVDLYAPRRLTQESLQALVDSYVVYEAKGEMAWRDDRPYDFLLNCEEMLRRDEDKGAYDQCVRERKEARLRLEELLRGMSESPK